MDVVKALLSGIGLRRWIWAGALAALLLGLAPGVAQAQIARVTSADAVQTVDEGDQVMLTATVSGAIAGDYNVSYEWRQLSDTLDTSNFDYGTSRNANCPLNQGDYLHVSGTGSVGPLTYSDGNLRSTDFDVTKPGVAGELAELGTRTLSFTAPETVTSDTYYFFFRALARNGGSATSCTFFSVTVNDADPPVLTAFTPQTVNPGEVLAVDVGAAASDPGGDPFIFALVEQTAGPAAAFAYTQNDRMLRITAPVIPAAADALFSVVAVDSVGLRSDPRTLTVRFANPLVADAGPDQRIRPGHTGELFSASRDPDAPAGDPGITYAWSQTSGPDAMLATPAAQSTRFTAPMLAADAMDITLSFSLRVSNTRGESSTDTVQVVVTPTPELPAAPQGAPEEIFVVDAGRDQTAEGGAVVLLDGSGTTGYVGTGFFFPRNVANRRLPWRWHQDSGPPVALRACPEACQPGPPVLALPGEIAEVADIRKRAFTAPAATASTQYLVFRLEVIRNLPFFERGRITAYDTVTVTIPGTGESTVSIADAGPSQEIAVADTTVTLSGSSSGGTGTPSYRWLQTDNTPYRVSLSSSTAQSPTFTKPAVPLTTDLIFALVSRTECVMDVCLDSRPSYVRIRILSDNARPEASAGSDQVVAEGDVVTLAGSGSDSGDTITYAWSQFGVPALVPRRGLSPAVRLSDASVAAPTFTAPTLTETTDLFFSLRVEDDEGAAAMDEVRIRVTATNSPPVVNNLPDITADEGDEVVLRGDFSDPEGQALRYRWTQTSGPEVTRGIDRDGTAVPAFPSALRRPSFRAPVQDENYTLEFSVTVTDLAGASTEESVTVSVSFVNDPPTVFAGTRVQSAAPGSTVMLGQSSDGISDPEGGVLSYAWRQVLPRRVEVGSGVQCRDGSRFPVTELFSGRFGPNPLTAANPNQAALQAFSVACVIAGYDPIPDGHADQVALSNADTLGASFTAPVNPRLTLFFELTVSDDVTPPGVSTAIEAVGVVYTPAVHAGADQFALEGATVTLDGSGTLGAESLSWEQTAGPVVMLDDATLAEPSFTVPDLDAETLFTFELTATDSEDRSATDTVNVTGTVSLSVAVSTGPGDFACATGSTGDGSMGNPCRVVFDPLLPESIAADEGAGVGMNAVVTDLRAAADVQDNPVEILWSRVSGPAYVNPTDVARQVFAFTAPTPLTADAVLVIRVTVTAGELSASDDITINLTAATSPNRPTASAGTPQTVTVDDMGMETLTDISGNVEEGATIRLNGSGTASSGGGDLSYSWEQSSPDSPRLLRTLPGFAGDSGERTFSVPQQLSADTAFTFQLVVLEKGGTDDEPTFIGSEVAEVTVTVAAGPNDAPTASAGQNRTVAEATEVTLDGSGSSDPENEALTYAWTQIDNMEGIAVSGIPPVVLSDAAAESPTFTLPNLAFGTTLVFSLVVTDARGLASEADSVTLTVTAEDEAPTANAGEDQFVRDGSLVALDGVGIDPEGGALGYTWTQLSGPVVALQGGGALSTSPSASFVVNLLEDATLVFSLIVTQESSGATGDPAPPPVVSEADMVSVTVEGAVNDPPVADAGGDQTVREGQTVYLNSAGSRDPEGQTLFYLWRQTSGPAVTFLNEAFDFTAPDLSGAASATLEFTLGVEDPGGLSATDTVTITVEPATDIATLQGLVLTAVDVQLAISPAFASNITAYSVALANGIEMLDVQAVARDAGAAIVIGGTAADGSTLTESAGTVSGLTTGDNSVTITVTSADTSATQTYTVTATVVAASVGDDTLSAMHVEFGSVPAIVPLTPAFSRTTMAYTATVPSRVDTVTVRYTTTQAGVVNFSGTAADGSTALVRNDPPSDLATITEASGLTRGENTLNFRIGPNTYTITITRAAGTDASLSALAVSYPGSAGSVNVPFSPAFDSGVADYGMATVVNEVTSVTVAATASDDNANIRVSGTAPGGVSLTGRATGSDVRAVLSGLGTGMNTITVVVTAGDGTTQQSYTVMLRRALGALRTLRVSDASVTGSEDSVTGAGETAFVEFTVQMRGADLQAEVMVDWTLAGANGANLPGTEAADFGTPVFAEAGGGTVNADGSGGTLRFPVGAAASRTVRVPLLQDALNEGPEQLTLRISDPCPASGVCSAGGGGDAFTPGLRLQRAAQSAEIAGSDDITVTLTAEAAQGILTEGEDARYVMRFGSTMVNGQPAAIETTTALTVPLTAMVGSSALTVPDAMAPAGSQMVAVTLPAALIDAGSRSGTQMMLTVAIGAPSGAADGTTAEAGDAPAARRVVGWVLTLSPATSAAMRHLVGEGGSFPLEVSLEGTPGPADLMIPWSVEVSGSVNLPVASDFACGDPAAACTSLPSGTLDLSGATSGTIRIATLLDTINESGADEPFNVLLGTPSGAQAGMVLVQNSEAFAEIADALRTLSVSALSTTVDEDSVTAAGETANATFTIAMRGTASPETDVVVLWDLSSPDDSFTLRPVAAGSGLGRSLGVRDLGPAGVVSGMVTFPAGTSVSFTTPVTRQVVVPIGQDALNEGAEQLRLTLRAVDRSAGCAGATSAFCTLITQAESEIVTVQPSDDITVFVDAVDDPRALVSGDSVSYRVSLGTTEVNGQRVPIVSEMPVTVPLVVTVGSASRTINVEVPARTSSMVVEVPDTTISELRQMAGGGTQDLDVSVGAVSAPSGGMARAGTQADATDQGRTAPLVPDTTQVSNWAIDVAPPAPAASGRAEVPEGGSYEVAFSLRGTAAVTELTISWSISGIDGSRGADPAEPADFGGSNAYSCGGATTATASCSSFPTGTVTFGPGETRATLSINIFDDDLPEDQAPEGFALTLTALGGANGADASLSGGLPRVLQVDIPALRADLGIADVIAPEGETAVFTLTLSGFRGGQETTQPVVVTYALGAPTDTATLGEDYTSAATGTITIPVGETDGQGSTAISIPLLQDGLLESQEVFTLFLTGVSGGGGTVAFVNPDSLGRISATGTITDDVDQARRRTQRISTLVAVLDRSSALMAAEAVSDRISRAEAGPGAAGASMAVAGRELIGKPGAAAEAAPNLGLALFGAAGAAGAGAAGGGLGGGVPGSGVPGGSPGGGGAFGGLSAGLAGDLNMGRRTALPSLARLASHSSFNLNAAGWDWDNDLTLWGSGGVTMLEGDPVLGGSLLEYDGDSTAFFFGGENRPRENLLTGVALGFALGDVGFTDHAPQNATLTGSVESDTLSIHPYASLWLSPEVNVWLTLGYGVGSVNLEERLTEGGITSISTAETDSETTTVSAGLAGRLQVLDEATQLSLRLQLTHASSELDATSFSNGVQQAAINARSTRLGGEAELARDFALPAGIALRPFASAQLRLDLGDAVSQDVAGDRDAAFDLGGGANVSWPDQGVTMRLAGRVQVNDTGHQEHRVSVDVNYDLGADSQGFTLALQSAVSERRAARARARGLLGSTSLGGASRSAFGAATGGLGVGAMQQSLSGEVAYGMAFRQFGRSGLLTPYGRFDLSREDQRWAAGLRLAETRGGLELGVEGGLDLNTGAAAAPRSYDLLLTGRMRF